MLKKIIFIVSLFAVISAHAQITMSLQVPPSGVLLKSQLWNILLVNSSSGNENVIIELTLSDANTNQPILTASTGEVILSPGANQLQADNISLINYNYISDQQTDRNPDGFVNAGSYIACYTVLPYPGQQTQPFAEECTPVEVEPLSPPLLNTPADGDTIQTNIPQFTWLPPAPVNIFSNLTYTMTLVEVQQGQNPADAIQQNVPVYTANELTDIFINYPSSGTALDTSKTYAWQIIAKNADQFAAQSEVWTFRISGNGFIVQLPDLGSYTKLKRDLNASVATAKGILKFDYDNQADDSTTMYSITDLGDNANTAEVIKSGELPLRGGENFISITLVNDERLMNNGIYLLQLTDSRGETWSVKFIYYEPDVTNQQ